jgi:hypothetical protein
MSIDAVDTDKFVSAYDLIMKVNAELTFQLEHNLLGDQPVSIEATALARQKEALAKEFPADNVQTHSSILARIFALQDICDHSVLQDFVRRESSVMFLHENLIRAAAVCSLDESFEPGEILQAANSVLQTTHPQTATVDPIRYEA